VIQRDLQNPIALAVLEGQYAEGDTIVVDVAGGELTFAREATMAEAASA
jgi:hypothetical protein